ncbi:rhomboid family intramembrane serine protease [Hamadaea sp. NPDC051192]|uniref:rhomboid family intramembrane serine protease n=1 Tax=Hamadaea sp. NPDC051192 TaxID=3154940 RepID=UPI0034292D8F
MKRFPWLTVVVFAGTAAVSLWSALDGDVLRALARDPAGFSVGGWWRLFSALLVQADGWTQLVFNLLTLAGFGYLVEAGLGRWRWAVLYFGAGLLGQALGYAWEPPGGGNSVAVCGLVGGLAAAAVLNRVTLPTNTGYLTALYAVALTGTLLGDWVATMIGMIVLVAAFVALRRTGRGTGILAVLVPLAGLVLLVRQDHHGASLLFGVLAGAVTLWRAPRLAPAP